MSELAPEQPITQVVVEALREGLGEALVSVVLFGSRARNQARQDSDWDVLLIARGLPERALERHVLLKRLMPSECRGAVSFIALTPEEFDTPLYLPSHYLDIAHDGRILFDPSGYAAERVSALQRLIAERSLQREQTEAGDLWRSRGKRTESLAIPWAVSTDGSR